MTFPRCLYSAFLVVYWQKNIAAFPQMVGIQPNCTKRLFFFLLIFIKVIFKLKIKFITRTSGFLTDLYFFFFCKNKTKLIQINSCVHLLLDILSYRAKAAFLNLGHMYLVGYLRRAQGLPRTKLHNEGCITILIESF